MDLHGLWSVSLGAEYWKDDETMTMTLTTSPVAMSILIELLVQAQEQVQVELLVQISFHDLSKTSK
jgi:hypothetical protein